MRYGFKPDNMVERLALLFAKIPLPVVDVLAPLVQTRALMCAVRCGVFEALRGPGAHAASTIAAQCKLDETCLEIVLRTLVPAGYIRKDADGYSLTNLSRRSLLRGSPAPLWGYVQFNYLQWRAIEHMENVLRNGQHLDLHHEMKEDADWEIYQRGMLDLARFAAPILAARMPVPRGASTLVDVGGSHGYLGAAICKKHPPMKSIVYDLPAAIPHAKKLAEEEGIDAIVEYRPADISCSTFGSSVDVALLANIVHHFSADANVELLGRVRAAMRDGGVVGIWDMIRAPEATRPELAAEMTALLFRLTSNSRSFTADEYAGWLTRAGFAKIRVIKPVAAPGQALVIGHA